MPKAPVPEKLCPVCGRWFAWRRRWADNWEEVRYCSRACGSRRLDATDEALESRAKQLARERGASKTFCPSEVARSLDDDWRRLMPRTHDAVRRLAAQGLLEVTQKGRVIDAAKVRGAYRVRRARRAPVRG